MSGKKQFVLEVSNFLVNFALMVIVWMIGNFLFTGITEHGFIEYNTDLFEFLNMVVLPVFYCLYLLLQNVFFSSVLYAISRYKIESKNKEKRRILGHNFMFNFIMNGTIIVGALEFPYVIKLFFIILLLLEFVPCFIKKYSKSLSCYILKIETVKITKKVKGDGISL